jgi:hypothetical protein
MPILLIQDFNYPIIIRWYPVICHFGYLDFKQLYNKLTQNVLKR